MDLGRGIFRMTLSLVLLLGLGWQIVFASFFPLLSEGVICLCGWQRPLVSCCFTEHLP
jgi:hypothetical protein